VEAEESKICLPNFCLSAFSEVHNIKHSPDTTPMSVAGTDLLSWVFRVLRILRTSPFGDSPKFTKKGSKNHSFGGCARTSPSANIRSGVDAHLKAAGIVASSMDTPIEVLRGKEMVINM
jgi:hypothetical protein